MLADILPPLANLSKAFQRKNLDYTLVQPLVSGTNSTLQNLKSTPGHHFATLDHVLATDLEPFAIHAPAVDTFKTSSHDKYLDVVKSHLKRRFPDVELFEAFSIFDGKNWPEELQLYHYGLEHLVTLANHLTTLVDLDELKREWELFKNAGASDSLPLRTLSTQEVMALLVQKEDLADLFPNLFRVALIGLLIPSSTADCERGFSALKRIKSPLRNQLSNAITVQLLFIAIEGPTVADFDFDAASSAWASQRNRRIRVSQYTLITTIT